MTEVTSAGSAANVTKSGTVSPSSSSNTSKSTKKKKRPKKGQCSFTADSPYFTAYVDKEMKSLSTLSDTLRDISSRAKTFGKCGKLMSEATRRLSQACKLQPHNEELGSLEELEWSEKEQRRMRERRKSVGDEMGQVLTVLGEVLDEVADAQIQMCESLEASLCLSLEAFAEAEVRDANSLKVEAEELTEEGESAFAKYLHGKGAGGNSAQATKDGSIGSGGASDDAVMQTWSKISEGVGNQLGRMGITSSGNEMNGNVSGSGNISPVRTSKRGKSNGSERSKEKGQIDKAIDSANTRLLLEEIQLAQANAELKRCHLLKRLDSIKSRRDIELGESALASLNGIKAFFHHCSDLIQGLTPRLQSIQSQQSKTRQKHQEQQPTMERREQGLRQVINEVKISAANAGVIADAISRGQTTGMGASIITDQPNSLEAIEEETRIWSLNELLTEHALFVRDQKPGIEVEGWLYKKASTRMAMSTWSKRWFILDKTGIYYLKGGSLSENGKFGSSNGSLERVKVCDIVLCTVREVVEKGKGNTAIRFCFEIISPNNRPYMLQALGPNELSTWIGSIRHCLERQLTHGNVPADKLLMKPGTPKTLRSSKGGFSPDSEDGAGTSNNMESPNVSSITSPPPKNPIVREIVEENLLCADCGMKRPEWVSLNIGLVMCIECSGVHRSLGVHISKIRSLRLDQLAKAEYRVIKSLGNNFCNSVWEADISKQKGWKKPKPTDDRKTKEEWIKSKYVWRGFINLREFDGLSEEEGAKKLQHNLYDNAKKGDVRGVARAIALGADVNWQNDDDGGKTPLHVCTTGSKENYQDWKGIETAELLIQNGANINVTCGEDKTVLDTALLENAEKELMEYLMARLG